MIRRFALLFLLTAQLAHASCYSTSGLKAYSPPGCASDYWQPVVEASGLFWNDWRSHGTATGFWPLFQPGNNVGYLQLTGGRFKHLWIASIGGGWRAQVSPCLGWGINAFADYGYCDSELSWWQGGAGLELFGGCWEARVNAYIPQTVRLRSGKERFSFQIITDGINNFIIEETFRRTDQARWGFDCEVGGGFCIGPGALWGHAGYFRFEGKRNLPIIQGPRLRLGYRVNLALPWGNGEAFVGGEWEHTHAFGDQTSLALRLTLPLSCYGCPKRCCMNTVCRQVGDPARRMNGIVLRSLAQTIINERDVTLCFYDQNGGGTGTQTDPTNFTTALACDIMFALANTGDIVIPAGSQMLDDQQIYAFPPGSDSVTVDFGNGVTRTITALPGNIGAVHNQMAGPLLLASNNRIFGLTFENGTSALSGMTRSNLDIDQAIFRSQTAASILLTEFGGDLTLNDSEFDSTATAFSLSNTNTDVDLTAATNTVSSSVNGFFFTADGTTVFDLDLNNNTFTDITERAFVFTKSGSGGEVEGVIYDNTLQTVTGGGGGPFGGAFQIDTDATAANSHLAFNISGNSLTDVTGGVGIAMNQMSAAAGNVDFNALLQDNTIDSVTNGASISLFQDSTPASYVSTFDLQSNTISNSTSLGIIAQTDSAGSFNLTLKDNAVNGAAATIAAYTLQNASAATYCATVSGNATDRTGADEGIVFEQSSSNPFDVTDLADIDSNNPDVMPATDFVPNQAAFTNRATDCPVPIVPLIPS